MQRTAVILGALFIGLVPAVAAADSFGDVSSQLREANHKAAETSSKIADFSGQIDVIQGQIYDTNVKISATNAGIADAQSRMAAKQVVLGEYVRSQYTSTNQTGLEILVGSSSFSQFVDRQQYLKSGQNKIAAALNEVLAIKKELDAKSAQLAVLSQQLGQAQSGQRSRPPA